MNIPKEIQDDLITYLEIARVALAPYTSSFDIIADELDLSDEEMIRLRENLQTHLNQQ